MSIRARAADPATAQALFDDGKRLMSQRDYVQACQKFEESQRLDPGLGTLFHLADCEEQTGKTATAWAGFLEVAAEAKAQGESAREAAAHDRAAALEPKLARLTLDPGASKDVPGFTVARDGVPIGPAAWLVAVPVDPGPHVFEAHASGRGPWTATVIAVAGAADVVTIPPLASAPGGGPTSMTRTTSAEADRQRHGNGQRVAGFVLGVAGVVGLGVGGYFGAVSWVRHDDAQSHCGANGCDPTGVSLRSDAVQAGNAATISLVAGGVLLLAGIITYVTAPRSFAPALAASRPFDVSVGPGGAFVHGVW
jgi:hypothetical protein